MTGTRGPIGFVSDIERLCGMFTSDSFIAAYLRREKGANIQKADVARIRAKRPTKAVQPGRSRAILAPKTAANALGYDDAPHKAETGSQALLLAMLRTGQHFIQHEPTYRERLADARRYAATGKLQAGGRA